jgi:hypothetical protein
MQLAVAQAEILFMQMQNQDSPPTSSSLVLVQKESVDEKSFLLQNGFGGNFVPQVLNNVNSFPSGNVLFPPQEQPLKRESLWT